MKTYKNYTIDWNYVGISSFTFTNYSFIAATAHWRITDEAIRPKIDRIKIRAHKQQE